LIESKIYWVEVFQVKIVFFRTKKPLPFGTLGVHKKKEFSEANEAFFIFDCLYYNGESLLGKLSIFYSLVTSSRSEITRRGWKESRARRTRV
jgi:DNA ligase-3